MRALIWSLHGCQTATRWRFGSTGESQNEKWSQNTWGCSGDTSSLNLCKFRAGAHLDGDAQIFMLQRPWRKQMRGFFLTMTPGLFFLWQVHRLGPSWLHECEVLMSTGKQGQNPAVYRLDVLSQLAFTQTALRFPDKITIVRSLTHTTIKTHSVLF